MAFYRQTILLFVLVLIGGAIFYFESEKPMRESSAEIREVPLMTLSPKESKSQIYDIGKEITTPDGFINTDAITISELVGKKVVLVDFWTYSCINCQRTLPYLNDWYHKYSDKGLEIIGVHTPEFEFEKNYENVAAAVKKFGIKYPVVLDNDFSTWTAYRNQYWPRKYLIDIDGFIVYDHIGEGAYAQTEEKIQKALTERAQVLQGNGAVAAEVREIEIAPDQDLARAGSPEIYFGAWRNEYLANGERGIIGEQELGAPATLAPNSLYLDGKWNIQREYAENASLNAKISFRYRAREVYFVAAADQLVRARIFVDGKPLGTSAGEDIFVESGLSKVRIRDERLYKLIRHKDYGEHQLDIIIENPGLKAFTFTFG